MDIKTALDFIKKYAPEDLREAYREIAEEHSLRTQAELAIIRDAASQEINHKAVSYWMDMAIEAQRQTARSYKIGVTAGRMESMLYLENRMETYSSNLLRDKFFPQEQTNGRG